jgi:hypothetical protein
MDWFSLVVFVMLSLVILVLPFGLRLIDTILGGFFCCMGLSNDNRVYTQTLICIFCWQVWKLRNMVIFQGALVSSFRLFYFNILCQYSLYTGMTSLLWPLYQSEKILIDFEDIQVMIQPYS